ncbi:MAG: FliO/MopB family protein [Phycisphaeraceae bacterium]
MRWAVVGVLCLMSCLGVAGQVSAEGATASDAERIARLRDQAGEGGAARAQADASQLPAQPDGRDAAVGADQPGDPEANSEAKPLPAIERTPLGQGAGDLFNDGDGPAAEPGQLGDGWLLSTLAALGIVLVLVFGLRWMLRRGGIVPTAAPQGSIVEVLSRTTVAPRSHVVLMRVGPRILVVNDSPNGMRTLATIEDPGEVAELLGAVDAARPTSMTKSFSGVMSRLSSGWSSDDDPADAIEPGERLGDGVTMDQTRGAVSSVRGRLAALASGGGGA